MKQQWILAGTALINTTQIKMIFLSSSEAMKEFRLTVHFPDDSSRMIASSKKEVIDAILRNLISFLNEEDERVGSVLDINDLLIRFEAACR